MMRTLITASIVGWVGVIQPQGPLFVPAPGSPVVVGPGSGQIVLADVNRDGHADMLTRHLLQKRLDVRLGDGSGRFQPVAGNPMTFGYEPGTAAAGDVNGDGIVDLGIASRDGQNENVHILLGDGKAGFTPAARSPFMASGAFERYKASLSFLDVNEDRKPDIVTANGQRHTLEILIGDGRAGFSQARVVPLEVEGVHSWGSGDVDGDGHLDLVVASGEERCRVVMKRGDGRGAFGNAEGLFSSDAPAPAIGALADLNGDGRPDIVLSHGRSVLLTVLVNDGRGRFAPAPGSPFNVGKPAFVVSAADVNRDKRADLVTTTVSGAAPWESGIVVLLGGSRGFLPAPGSPFRAGPGAYTLTVGDINGDGRPDVASSSFEGNAVTVLLGR